MVNPVPTHPTITTPWGIPGSWAAGRHTGQDYGSPGIDGARVVAAAPGRVTFAGWGGWGSAYGLHVIIDHGAVQAGYMHLSGAAVTAGQQVGEGQLLGYVGTTGNSTGPHLHYEERVAPYSYGADRRPEIPDTTTDWWDTMTPKEREALVDDIADAAAARVLRGLTWAYKGGIDPQSLQQHVTELRRDTTTIRDRQKG